MLLFVSAFRGDGVGADTYTYLNSFSLLGKINIFGYYTETFEIGYVLLNKILYFFTNDAQIVLFVCSFFTLSLLGGFFYKYSTNYYISTVLFVGMGFYTLTFTAIRQWLAIAIACWGMAALWNSRRVLGGGLLLISGMFHTTALLLLPLILFAPIDKMKYFTLVLIMVMVYLGIHNSGLDFLSPFMEGTGKFDHYLISRYNTSTDFGLGILKIIVSIVVVWGAWNKICNCYVMEINEKQKIMWICIMLLIGAFIMLLGYDVQIISRAAYNFFIFICLAIPFLQPKNKVYSLMYHLLVIIGSSIYFYQSINADRQYYIYTNIFF